MTRRARSSIKASEPPPRCTALQGPLTFRLVANEASTGHHRATKIAFDFHSALLAALPRPAADGLARVNHRGLRVVVLPVLSRQRVAGLGVALPHDLATDARAQLRDAIADVRRRGFGGPYRIELDPHPQMASIAGPARTWRSATPYLRSEGGGDAHRDAYDRLRADLARVFLPADDDRGAERISGAIEHIELEDDRDWPRHGRGGSFERATVTFVRPIRGPLAIGHESHRGFGVLVPML